MSERTPEYLGPFAVHLRSFIEEKRLLGCRYMEEERLAHKFDHMSMEDVYKRQSLASFSFFVRSDADNFRKLILKLPSKSPSLST